METKNENFGQIEVEELAKKRIKRIKRFYYHLLIYSIGVVIFTLKKYFNAPFNFPPLHYLNDLFMYCWTFIIVVQGLRVFIKELIFGKKWEAKQINKIIDSESLTKK